MVHNIPTIRTTFSDVATNSDTVDCRHGIEYKYDPTFPEVVSMIETGTETKIIENGQGNSQNALSYYAGPRTWEFGIRDTDTAENVGMISGIESFSVKVTDKTGNPICSAEKTYALDSNRSVAHNETVTLACDYNSGIQKTGTYTMNMELKDYAGNIDQKTFTVKIVPNRDIQWGGEIVVVPQVKTQGSICAQSKKVQRCTSYKYDTVSCTNYDLVCRSEASFSGMPSNEKICTPDLEV